MAAPCKNENSVPAATDPMDACQAAAKLPATGPMALKPTAFSIAGVAQASEKVVIPPPMPAVLFGLARIHAEVSFMRSKTAAA